MEPFRVRTEVRQGSLLSPILFLVVLDWVTTPAYGARRTGIQWTLTRKLEDLDFADELCLLTPHNLQHTQEKTVALQSAYAREDRKINIGKTREMRIQVRDGNPIYIGNEDFQRVDNFSYLGSVVRVTGGTEEDIIAHIRKDQHASVQFGRQHLSPWRRRLGYSALRNQGR